MKLVFCVVLFSTAVFADEKYFRKLDSLVQEPSCSRSGGICTFAADCSQLVEESNLCPNQQRQGVECCYGVSVRETRCQKRGGECKPKSEFCGPTVIYKEATDCSNDQNCCILVN